MRVKTIKVFHDVSMGKGHHGLTELAKEHGNIDVSKLAPGELLMFLNRRKDKLKILGSKGWVIGYIKTPTGHQLELDALQYLPQTFGAGGFNYPAALKQSLSKRLYGRGKSNPLQAARAMERSGL